MDALHVAIAAYHEVDFLLKWNCKHIANAKAMPNILKVIRDLGYIPPIICTPEEMVNDEPDTTW